MKNKGLLFIPDISGFTKFVNDIEIAHSLHIIQELLEILLDANFLGIEVSDVEGDAILFYKFVDSTDISEIYQQVEKMFCAFHEHLKKYKLHRNCECAACTTAANLTLKIITHYGEFRVYDVRNFQRLFGKDVIVAHQLLKNDIAGHEYWLVTKDLMRENTLVDYRDWMKWERSTKQTEHGEIHYHFTCLDGLIK